MLPLARVLKKLLKVAELSLPVNGKLSQRNHWRLPCAGRQILKFYDAYSDYKQTNLVPEDHPIRQIKNRSWTKALIGAFSPTSNGCMPRQVGRRYLRAPAQACLLIALYSGTQRADSSVSDCIRPAIQMVSRSEYHRSGLRCLDLF